MVIALASDSFGGVLGLIVLWFGALVGPIAIPMLLGMLPAFRRCGPTAAIVSWAVGLVVFAVTVPPRRADHRPGRATWARPSP